MKILLGNRGCGKTSKLIKVSANENKHIICSSKERCNFIERQAKLMRLEIPKPLTIDEVSTLGYKRFARNKRGYLVDDFETVLEKALSNKVDYVTTSCRFRK